MKVLRGKDAHSTLEIHKWVGVERERRAREWKWECEGKMTEHTAKEAGRSIASAAPLLLRVFPLLSCIVNVVPWKFALQLQEFIYVTCLTCEG